MQPFFGQHTKGLDETHPTLSCAAWFSGKPIRDTGSHLATFVSLGPRGDLLERPDLSGLMYGTNNLSDRNLAWLERSLYFRKLSPQEIVENRLLNRITEWTPPAFLVHACDDDVCKLEETMLYAQKLDQGIPMEMHLIPRGGHGFGLGRSSDGTDQWLML